MGEVHQIGEGRVTKLKHLREKDVEQQNRLIGVAGMISQRDQMIAQGYPQELIDHVTSQIDESFARKTDEEKRHIELLVSESKALRDRLGAMALTPEQAAREQLIAGAVEIATALTFAKAAGDTDEVNRLMAALANCLASIGVTDDDFNEVLKRSREAIDAHINEQEGEI